MRGRGFTRIWCTMDHGPNDRCIVVPGGCREAFRGMQKDYEGGEGARIQGNFLWIDACDTIIEFLKMGDD